MRRRAFLAFLSLPGWVNAASVRYPAVRPNPKFMFPRDDGAHPGFRTEWWYITGWLDWPAGFQITFFRARPDNETSNPSSFTPRQVLLAHAAVSDPRAGRLVHEDRAARAGFSLAEAETDRTGVWIDDWRLEQIGDEYHVRIAGREFDINVSCIARERVLQGEGGFSRKGHRAEEASYYYSRPQMNVVGKVNGKEANGVAWLDHEWSSAYLAPEAAGWDWCGINLFDGRSFMAFRMRGKKGGVHYAPPGVTFEVLRTWKSPRTGTEYPVSMKIQNGKMLLRLEPLMDDQELDVRASTGTIYWEGAVRAFDAAGAEVGRGYLELTGYWRAMKL